MEIGKSLQLLAQDLGTAALDTDVTVGLELTPEQESLLMTQAELHLNQLGQSSSEKEAMWIPDLKTNQALAIAALGLTAGLPATAASDSFAVGVCRTARQTFPAQIHPTTSAGSYLEMYRKGVSKEDDPFDGAKVSLLVKPKHGAVKLEEGQLAIDSSWYKYYPQAGFEGTDRFVMQVEKSGIKVKIYYVIKALDDVEATAGYCPKEFWKISQSDFDPNTQDYAA